MAVKRSASRARTTKGGATPAKRTSKREPAGSRPARDGGLPSVVYAQASPRSLGGVSMFDSATPITPATSSRSCPTTR